MTSVLPMQQIADDIHAARVASRVLYTDGLITLEQYKIQKEVLDNNVLTHIHWYKTYNPKFNELEFVAASGDGSAVF